MSQLSSVITCIVRCQLLIHTGGPRFRYCYSKTLDKRRGGWTKNFLSSPSSITGKRSLLFFTSPV
ncbi:hypothetical protein J4Q44_G00040490 [Coregonus suidteri]|uniref:Uncharacterized protein n=1 Tax=Coregonus suidteri TaxID=861788 RepID=A0AAN8MD88_9TELE